MIFLDIKVEELLKQHVETEDNCPQVLTEI